MASTEPVQLAPVAEGAIDDCLALSSEAGWNQVAEDWQVFLRRGTVFGRPDGGGRLVATGAILPYPDDFAWISMVLVTAGRRRQRIGTGILQACCAELERCGLVAILDATPAGERVYRPLGFEPMLPLTRWQGDAGAATPPPATVRQMADVDIDAVVALDAVAFGARRAFLLENFFRRAPHLAFVSPPARTNLRGFVLARPGRLATQIGPLVACDEGVASALLDAALGATTGPVFIDLADRWQGLVARLRQRDFAVQRTFLRMGLRCHVPFGDPSRLFAVAGPEFG